MKTPKDSLEFIAYQNGLALIETTSQSSGYPSHLQHAIIGIDSFEQAEKLAEENDLSIEIFTKRDGWNLYYRTGNVAYKELTVFFFISNNNKNLDAHPVTIKIKRYEQ